MTVLFAEPDGTNINQGSGSTHPEALAPYERARHIMVCVSRAKTGTLVLDL